MERDDLIVNDSYATRSNHTEEQGVKIRKKIWRVTALLAIITTLEIATGILVGEYMGAERAGWAWETIKYSYIILTVIKAAYIVLIFMHLGDEKKSLKNYILYPYFIFIAYMIFLYLIEGFNVFTY